MVETSSPTNLGDSGGPMVNDHGELVAVVQGFSRRDKAVSWNIDVREVRSLLETHFRALGETWEADRPV